MLLEDTIFNDFSYLDLDYEEEEEKEEEEEGFKSRITSAAFLMIMEECIRTFMNFLKADKEKPCQKIIKAFFGRTKRGSVDPTLVHLMKKVNTKVSVSTYIFTTTLRPTTSKIYMIN